METRVISPAGEGVDTAVNRAAELLLSGALVALPTETVYGLGANGLDAAAVAAIYTAKGRPDNKPISLLVGSLGVAADLVREIPDEAALLASAFWPGPLTMILDRTDRVPDIVAAGGRTVGLRCPQHPITLAILQRAGVPVAAPSANLSGMPSPKRAEDVLAGLDGRIHAVVDGGQCTLGVESTILDLTASPPRILRQGGLAKADIEAVIGEVM